MYAPLFSIYSTFMRCVCCRPFCRAFASADMARCDAGATFNLHSFLYFVRLIHNRGRFYENRCFAVSKNYIRLTQVYL